MNDDLFNFLVATDTLDDFLGNVPPNKNQETDEQSDNDKILENKDEENTLDKEN